MLTKALAYAVAAGFMLSLAGCNLSTETAVTEAAQKRWDALIIGDTEQAYHYYTTAFQQSMPYDHFKNNVRGIGLWSHAKVSKVNCEASGKSCKVDVDVTVSMKMRGLSTPVDTTDRVSETWVREGWFSDWRYVKQ